jgi:hypothetical protein
MGKRLSTSCNPLANPVMEGDIIVMPDKSEWPVKRGIINWELHPCEDSSMPILQCYSMIDLCRHIAEIEAGRS